MREPRAWGMREEEMHRRWQREASNEAPRRADRYAAAPAREPLWCPLHGFGTLATPTWEGGAVTPHRAETGAVCAHRRGC